MWPVPVQCRSVVLHDVAMGGQFVSAKAGAVKAMAIASAAAIVVLVFMVLFPFMVVSPPSRKGDAAIAANERHIWLCPGIQFALGTGVFHLVLLLLLVLGNGLSTVVPVQAVTMLLDEVAHLRREDTVREK